MERQLETPGDPRGPRARSGRNGNLCHRQWASAPTPPHPAACAERALSSSAEEKPGRPLVPARDTVVLSGLR